MNAARLCCFITTLGRWVCGFRSKRRSKKAPISCGQVCFVQHDITALHTYVYVCTCNLCYNVIVCTLQPAQRAQRAVGPNKPNASCSNLLHKAVAFWSGHGPKPRFSGVSCLFLFFFCSFICRRLSFSYCLFSNHAAFTSRVKTDGVVVAQFHNSRCSAITFLPGGEGMEEAWWLDLARCRVDGTNRSRRTGHPRWNPNAAFPVTGLSDQHSIHM